MKSFIRRFLTLGVALILCVSCFSVPVSADAPTWCKVYVKQGGVCHPAGCTVVSLQLILQNSGTLKPEWQLSGAITSRSFRDGSPYDKFDIECATNPGISEGIMANKTSDSVKSGNFTTVAGRVCESGVSWSRVSSGASVDGQSASNGSSTDVVTGLGGKDFKNMSHAEVVSSMKAFWNAGIWCAVAVEYKGGTKDPTNGPAGYKGNHWVMFSGVDDSDVYFNDPATGSTTRLSTAKSYGGNYHIVYLVPFKNSKTTPADVAGGNVQFSQQDISNLTDMGVGANTVTGLAGGSSISVTFSDALFASCRLTEANMNDLLDIASVENMNQEDLEVLDGWRDNVDGNKKEFGFISILRWVVQFVGILVTLWALLVYLAFWFDHINSFFYLDLLHILTLGKLHICPPNEKPTFSMGKEVKDKTVSHGQILCICITAILVGSMMISGVFYALVTKLVHFVMGFVWG